MADTKISGLTALTGANVTSADDVLPIVDTSATQTKKITVDELDTALWNKSAHTLGANYVSTRAAGTVATGNVLAARLNVTFTGDVGGATNMYGHVKNLDSSGANSVSYANASDSRLTISGSGSIANAICNGSLPILSSSGGATLLSQFYAASPSLTSTGAIGIHGGFVAENLGHASLVSTVRCFYAADQTVNVAATAFYGAVSSGTGKFNLNMVGTAQNFLQGITGIGVAASSTTQLNLPASTTTLSSMRIAQGSAPTSPVNGDVWMTSAGLFYRANGATVGPLT